VTAFDPTQLPGDLPVPADDGAAAGLAGRAMPAVALPSTDGGTVRLDTLGRGRTVLYAYPMTGTPGVDPPDGWDAIPGARGCTPESCAFRDHHGDLAAAGAAVYGISTQPTDVQREAAQRLHLPFALLSDTHHGDGRSEAVRGASKLAGEGRGVAVRRASQLARHPLAEALRLPTMVVEGTTMLKRLTLVVRDGRIEHVFYPVFPPDGHAEEVLGWLRRHPPA
jgi:peroxiredoxin